MTPSAIGAPRKGPTVSENSRRVSAIILVRGLITLTLPLTLNESRALPPLAERELVQSNSLSKVIELTQKAGSL